MQKVEIYTDGACSGNPGTGGFGVVLKCGEQEKELSGAYSNTTNNRMEIMAAIKGLEALKRSCDVTLYSDSRYLIDAVNKRWVYRWKAKGWMRNKREPAKNVDLWKRLLKAMNGHRVRWVWVRGHSDNQYNNRCDELAVRAIREKKQAVDKRGKF